MKYEGPVERSQSEIEAGLSMPDGSDEHVIGLVLSALYYLQTDIAGDILIDQFEKAEGQRKSYLMNLFSTFYGMHRTIHRIDDSLRLLQEYESENPEMAAEIRCMFDEISERRQIYLRNTGISIN